jgi:hypothetical protein
MKGSGVNKVLCKLWKMNGVKWKRSKKKGVPKNIILGAYSKNC